MLRYSFVLSGRRAMVTYMLSLLRPSHVTHNWPIEISIQYLKSHE